MRRKGFTLAEVLITLTIVGVVAALTLPATINKIEEQKIKGLVKKTVAVLVQANKMAKANYDYEENDFTSCVNPETETLAERKSFCSLVNTYVPSATYIQNTDPNHPGQYKRGLADCPAYSFSSGVVVASIGDLIYIDVNGKKGPNKTTHGTRSGNIMSGYPYSNFSAPVYLEKPSRFYDVYEYNIKGYTTYPGDAAMQSTIGATIWLLTH